MTNAAAEVIESYAEAGKLLVHEWRDYASTLATDLESGYDAERAAANLGTAVSLTLETWTRLTIKTLEAIDILNAPERQMAESEELSTQYKGADLMVTEDLVDAFDRTIPADRATFDPSPLGDNQSTFTVHVNVTGYRPGIYDGKVLATASPNKVEEIPFQIKFPK
jgi:hypothetical protein